MAEIGFFEYERVRIWSLLSGEQRAANQFEERLVDILDGRSAPENEAEFAYAEACLRYERDATKERADELRADRRLAESKAEELVEEHNAGVQRYGLGGENSDPEKAHHYTDRDFAPMNRLRESFDSYLAELQKADDEHSEARKLWQSFVEKHAPAATISYEYEEPPEHDREFLGDDEATDFYLTPEQWEVVYKRWKETPLVALRGRTAATSSRAGTDEEPPF